MPGAGMALRNSPRLSEAYLPQVQPYHPATFLERGVLVPFTTPTLAGTRARPAEKSGLELVIPNPSGARGVYVIGWSSIASLCRPTLHDRQLNERIAALRLMTPSAIRRIGREVAAEGLAGEDAMEAASRAAEIERQDRLVVNYMLLMALMAQVNQAPPGAGSEPPSPTDMEERARHTVASIAPRLGRSTVWLAAALEAIADMTAGVGRGMAGRSSRLLRVMAQIQQSAAAISAWSGRQGSEIHTECAEMICAVAEFTLGLARTALAQARDLTTDMIALLSAWSRDPDPVARIATRPEWLLDGWEQICLIWQYAEDDAQRRAAVVEMAGLLPVLPREVRDWAGYFIETEPPTRLRRMIPLNEDWRTGATVLELIARNEQIVAATC